MLKAQLKKMKNQYLMSANNCERRMLVLCCGLEKIFCSDTENFPFLPQKAVKTSALNLMIPRKSFNPKTALVHELLKGV